MANEFISTKLLQTALPVLGLGLLTRAGVVTEWEHVPLLLPQLQGVYR